MEGITTFIYRNAFHRYYGGIDKYFTPFLANKTLNYKDINDVMPEHNQGIPLIPQILTNQADTFLSIADQLASYGYPEVNLNLGCPSGTVVSRKRGAGFLSVPELLDAFLNEIFEKCPLEISIKTRIGISSLDEWEALLSIYSKYPIQELIVHARTQQEFYSGSPHPEAFRMAQDSLAMPLCYNGDIFSTASLEALEQQIPPLERVMLGRGAVADPQLPMRLKEKSPALTKDLRIFEAFHNEILEGYTEFMSGEQPVLFRMKELWAYMGSYWEISDKQLKKLRKCNRLSDYKDNVRSILESFIFLPPSPP